jgi:putative oxidoreductase
MKSFRLITAWILQCLLAVLFTIQGAMKVGGSTAWISRFAGWGYPDHFYLAIGLAELCGAGFLLIPKLARSGAILLIVIMIGATVTHLLHREPQVVTTLVLTALLVGVVYLRRAGLAGALKGS